MDPQPGQWPLRPMTLSELLNAVYRLYRGNFWLLLAVAAVVQVPYEIFVTLLQTRATRLSQEFSALQSGPGSSHHVQLLLQAYWQANGVAVSALAVFALLALPLGLAAMTSAGADRYQNRQSSVRLAFRVAGRRWLPVMGVFLLLVGFFIAAVMVLGLVGALLTLALNVLGVVLLVLLGIAAFVVGLVAYFRVIVAIPVVVLEPIGPWRAIQRSWSLSRGHIGYVLGVLVVLAVLVAMIAFALGLGAGLLALAAGGTGSTSGHVTLAVLTGAIELVLTPVSTLGAMLLYFNLRGRQEAAGTALRAGVPALQP